MKKKLLFALLLMGGCVIATQNVMQTKSPMCYFHLAAAILTGAVAIGEIIGAIFIKWRKPAQ